MYEISNDVARRTITTRMSGFMTLEEMKRWAEDYRKATDAYGGKPHLVLADMRGLKPMDAETGALMGSTIGYARGRGVACCAHLSDSTIARLQAGRLARESSPGDDVTIDVVSLEEATNLLTERRANLMLSGKLG